MTHATPSHLRLTAYEISFTAPPWTADAFRMYPHGRSNLSDRPTASRVSAAVAEMASDDG